MNDRVILHCDCNSFFASVESVMNPEYKKVPMAVCGSQDDRHGIVLAKNELAKRYGIVTAETIVSAKKKCPDLVIAPPHHSLYTEFSAKANQIYSRYTDMIEPFGIDESWLDVTASCKLFGSGYEIAQKISNDIKSELGITVSVGVSFNKVFAKLGSDYKKPDAITVITKENFKKLLYPLPVSAMLFVGKRTEDILLSLGVKTLGELSEVSLQMLSMKLGKMGEMLYKYVHGEDDSEVCSRSDDNKTISNGFTFRHDLCGVDEWRAGIDFLSEELGSKLRANGMKCCTVQLTLKDEFLNTIQRQHPQIPPSDIAAEISSTALDILREEWSPTKPIRMITVTAANLIKNEQITPQLSFFEAEDASSTREKRKETEIVIDKIRKKYGNSSIIKGDIINSDLGVYNKKG